MERQSTFESISDLYEYFVITVNETYVPTNKDDRFYPNTKHAAGMPWRRDGKRTATQYDKL